MLPPPWFIFFYLMVALSTIFAARRGKYPAPWLACIIGGLIWPVTIPLALSELRKRI